MIKTLQKIVNDWYNSLKYATEGKLGVKVVTKEDIEKLKKLLLKN